MGKIKIVLCDTNKNELAGYAAICCEICDRVGVPADLRTYSNSNDLMFDMGDITFSASVDVFIVDPEDGFETVSADVRKAGYDGLILYLSHTYSPEFCKQAFNVGAFHFAQKGSDRETLSQFHEIFEQSLQAAKRRERKFFVASHAGKYRKIEMSDIYYFETEANHVIKVAYNGGSFSFSSSLQELEETFRDRGFVRVHRSYLVAIDSIHRVDTSELILNNSSRIPVSRNKFPALKAAVFS